MSAPNYLKMNNTAFAAHLKWIASMLKKHQPEMSAMLSEAELRITALEEAS